MEPVTVRTTLMVSASPAAHSLGRDKSLRVANALMAHSAPGPGSTRYSAAGSLDRPQAPTSGGTPPWQHGLPPWGLALGVGRIRLSACFLLSSAVRGAQFLA
jgi:hypothetical protein